MEEDVFVNSKEEYEARKTALVEKIVNAAKSGNATTAVTLGTNLRHLDEAYDRYKRRQAQIEEEDRVAKKYEKKAMDAISSFVDDIMTLHMNGATNKEMIENHLHEAFRDVIKNHLHEAFKAEFSHLFNRAKENGVLTCELSKLGFVRKGE